LNRRDAEEAEINAERFNHEGTKKEEQGREPDKQVITGNIT
jgi:hypothetical protein